MTVLLGALVLAGRILLILVLAVLAVAVVLLLAPVGLTLRWTPAAGVSVGAYAGPLHRVLYPWQHRKKPKKEKSAPKKEKREASSASPAQPALEPSPEAAPPSPDQQPEASLPHPAQEPAPAASEEASADPEPPLPPLEPVPEDLTPGEQDALLGAARIFFGTLAPYRARLLRGITVQKLHVFWTVTGEDAADTAVAYGRRMALINNLLALARQFLTIRAESLRMEPDFTGEMAGKRIFSCQIRTRPYIILLILFYLMRRDKQGKVPLNAILDQLGTLS